MYRVAILEDDLTLAAHLEKLFIEYGYEVDHFADAGSLLKFTADTPVHIFILDVVLPGPDGFWACNQIRSRSSAPILFLSSRDSSMDVVHGLSVGGDDYLSKPFEFPVLLAKVQALLRRGYELTERSPGVIRWAGLVLHLSGDRLCMDSQSPEGEGIQLTRNEARIIQALLEAQGAVVSRNMLIELLWKRDAYIDDNTLTVNVARLRRRLDELGYGGGRVETCKGEGYRLI